MKICTKCKKEKDLEEFNKNKTKKDGYNNICRICSSERSKQYYTENKEHHVKVIRQRTNRVIKENRQKVYDYCKTHPCVDCGETNPIVLDFDHRDNCQKVSDISSLITSGCSWAKIETEIAKM